MRVMGFDLDGETPLAPQWGRLRALADRHRPDLLVLPEMPFAPWLAAAPSPDAAAWDDAVASHASWIDRLDELHAGVVVTTRPVTHPDARRHNEAVVHVHGTGVVATRHKTFLPDEPGFHEARWYRRGPVAFPVVTTPAATLGLLVCTELWFPEHARALGRRGAQLLAVPRATPASSLDRWEAGARVLAVVGGAFCLSVNRAGGTSDATFGGGSLLVAPEGEVLARSTPDHPHLVAEIDLGAVARARDTYPRYVDDTPVRAT